MDVEVDTRGNIDGTLAGAIWFPVRSEKGIRLGKEEREERKKERVGSRGAVESRRREQSCRLTTGPSGSLAKYRWHLSCTCPTNKVVMDACE